MYTLAGWQTMKTITYAENITQPVGKSITLTERRRCPGSFEKETYRGTVESCERWCSAQTFTGASYGCQFEKDSWRCRLYTTCNYYYTSNNNYYANNFKQGVITRYLRIVGDICVTPTLKITEVEVFGKASGRAGWSWSDNTMLNYNNWAGHITGEIANGKKYAAIDIMPSYIKIRSNAFCNANDILLSQSSTSIEDCVNQCANKFGCKYFAYGINERSGRRCRMIQTDSKACREGFRSDNSNDFYELIPGGAWKDVDINSDDITKGICRGKGLYLGFSEERGMLHQLPDSSISKQNVSITGELDSSEIINKVLSRKQRSSGTSSPATWAHRSRKLWITKVNKDTDLRFYYHDNIRCSGNNVACAFYVTLNGKECVTPNTLNLQINSGSGSSESNVFPATMMGFCHATSGQGDNILPGEYLVEIRERSVSGQNGGSPHVGWPGNLQAYIEVEEVPSQVVNSSLQAMQLLHMVKT
jgi:hypothetical protein